MFQQFTQWLQTLPPDQQVMVIGILAAVVLIGGGALVYFTWKTISGPAKGAATFLFLTPAGIAILLLIFALASPTAIPLPWGGQIGGGGLVVNVSPEIGETVQNLTAQAQPVVVGQTDLRLRYLQDLQTQDSQGRRILGNLMPASAVTDTVRLQEAVNRDLLAVNLAVNEPRLSFEVWGQVNGYTQWLLDVSMIMSSAPIVSSKVITSSTGITRTVKITETVSLPSSLPQGVNTALMRLAAKAPEVEGADRKCDTLPLGRITSEAEWQREVYRIYLCGDLLDAQVQVEMKKVTPNQTRIAKLNEQIGMLATLVTRLDISWAAYVANNPLATPTPVTAPSKLP